jgi:hypothetical protein
MLFFADMPNDFPKFQIRPMVSIYLRLREFGDGRGINNAPTDRLVQNIENGKYDKFQNVTAFDNLIALICEFKPMELPKNVNLRA